MDVVIEDLTQRRTWLGVIKRIDSGDLLEIQACIYSYLVGPRIPKDRGPKWSLVCRPEDKSLDL
jgi:hypothetical protein